MNPEQIEQTYLVASAVFDEQMTAAEGVKRLEQHGVNRNSAQIYIRLFRHLLHGESFQRSGSAPLMDWFLSGIATDRGLEALRTAIGALWLHVKYYEEITLVNLREIRKVLARHEANLAQTQNWARHEVEFQQSVEKALKDNAKKRQQRLQDAPKLPAKSMMQIEVFRRNPDVVAEVLLRAKGKCERCQQAAPFKRKSDGTPYLEVHHKRQLADDGEDTVENAEALCPNCHRKEHFGLSDAAGNSRTN